MCVSDVSLSFNLSLEQAPDFFHFEASFKLEVKQFDSQSYGEFNGLKSSLHTWKYGDVQI